MMILGYTRGKKPSGNDDNKYSRAGEIMTSAGLGLMAALLIGFMPLDDARCHTDDAVYVMSTSDELSAVSADSRDELVMPEKSTSAEGEVSFFEIIGEFFAEMIFGGG